LELVRRLVIESHCDGNIRFRRVHRLIVGEREGVWLFSGALNLAGVIRFCRDFALMILSDRPEEMVASSRLVDFEVAVEDQSAVDDGLSLPGVGHEGVHIEGVVTLGGPHVERVVPSVVPVVFERVLRLVIKSHCDGDSRFRRVHRLVVGERIVVT